MRGVWSLVVTPKRQLYLALWALAVALLTCLVWSWGIVRMAIERSNP
jgi:hypothetical protein